MNGLEYLIFHERDLRLIDRFLKMHHRVLDNKNFNGDNILAILIRLYVSIGEEAVDEINYLYNVIFLFKNRFSYKINKDKYYYLKIINECNIGEKQHIIKLINLLNNNYLVLLEELENKYNISFSFPDNIINEMYGFSMDNNMRYNFTNQEVITIDSKNAMCLDDAIYLEKNKNGTYTLYIHIVDIPAFVPYNSFTANEAMKREETLYLGDTIVPMYPEYIGNNMCSLIPNNNRNVISLVVGVDSDFSVMEDDFSIVRGKIKVKNRLSYSEADNKIFNPDYSNLSKMLINLFKISKKRRKSNKKKDLYRKYENMFCKKSHHESLNVDISPSANIVHEMMILINYLVAYRFKKESLPFIYREVFLPDDEFIRKQLTIARNMSNDKIDNKEFIGSIKGTFMEGVYIDYPKFHKGLKLPCYSHISCPARRYADSFCEYLIYDFIFNEMVDDKNIDLWSYRIKELIKHLNKKKKSNELFTVEYNYLMQKKLIRKNVRK